MAIGVDRVQPAKYETTAEGGQDADQGIFANPTHLKPQEDALESAGLYLQDASNRDENVYVARDNGEVVARDEVATTPSPLQTLSKHANLDSLLHELDESYHAVPTWSSGDLTQVDYYDSPTEPQVLLRRVELSYTNGDLTGYIITQYDSVGSWKERLTAVVNYSGGEFSSLTVTKTEAS